MRTTTTALAVGAAALALPVTAKAQVQSDFQVPLAGHLTVQAQMRTEHTELAQQRLTRKAWRLARKLAHAREDGFSPVHYRRRVADDAPARLAERVRRLRERLRSERRREKHRRRAAQVAAKASPALEAIAACESGGNPTADTGNGFYGKFQFDASTWASVGGTGNPAAASEAEQDRRAAILYAREGASPWPVCGR
jgi:Transglycosylase-like domain